MKSGGGEWRITKGGCLEETCGGSVAAGANGGVQSVEWMLLTCPPEQVNDVVAIALHCASAAAIDRE